MKIAFDLPIPYLRLKLGDFDYALAHLMWNESSYFDYFNLKSKEYYLDNSAFELGESVDDVLFELLKEVSFKPSVVVMPDVLDNTKGTLERSFAFYGKIEFHFGRLPFKVMGVVQGTTLEELEKCYTAMVSTYDLVGLTYDCKGYQDERLKLYGQNRGGFIKYLRVNRLFRPSIPLHALGMKSVEELVSSNIKNFYSMDTATPIMLALEGKKLMPDNKNESKLHTHINNPIWKTKQVKTLVRDNVRKFYSYLG